MHSSGKFLAMQRLKIFFYVCRAVVKFEAAIVNKCSSKTSHKKIDGVIFSCPLCSPVTLSELSCNKCFSLGPFLTALVRMSNKVHSRLMTHLLFTKF